MSPSGPRSDSTSQQAKKPMSGLSFAFPMQMPRGGTGAGTERSPAKPRKTARPG